MYPCYFPTYSEVGGIPKGFLDATLDTTQNTKKDAAGGATKQEAAGDVTLLIHTCLQPSPGYPGL